MRDRVDWLTIVTTCMGRLSQLKVTLPRNLLLGFPIVLVDWSCPEHVGDWVEANLTGVSVLRVPGEAYYSMSRSRNRGLALVQTEFVAFLDGDVFMRQPIIPWLNAEIKNQVNWGSIYGGSLIVSTAVCRELGGYDEVLEGWGAEDDEMFDRLNIRLGRKQAPRDAWRRTMHSDEERVVNFKVKNMALTYQIGSQYREILTACREEGIALTFDQRKTLYRDIQRRNGITGEA
jgi:hypothetical protein